MYPHSQVRTSATYEAVATWIEPSGRLGQHRDRVSFGMKTMAKLGVIKTPGATIASIPSAFPKFSFDSPTSLVRVVLQDLPYSVYQVRNLRSDTSTSLSTSHSSEGKMERSEGKMQSQRA
ncbi:hypothetical protein VTO58DRAFT_107488 [Aureobasidium pullulans]